MIFTEDLNPESLPPIIVQMVALIGIDATEVMIKQFAGGSPIYIPSRVMGGNGITAAIGIDAARALSEEFGGTLIRIPKCAVAARQHRDRGIRALRGQGRKLKHLSLEFNLSISRIWKVCGSV